jgi:hypothetical protein
MVNLLPCLPGHHVQRSKPRRDADTVGQRQIQAGGSKHLRYPPASSRGALPVRPERHVPHSIASIRRQLTARLVEALPRCPCCLRQQRGSVNEKMTQ